MSTTFGALAHFPPSDEPTGVSSAFALDGDYAPQHDDRLSDGLERLIGWAIADAEFLTELLSDAVTAARRRGGVFSPRELAVIAPGAARDVAELAELWLTRWSGFELPATGAQAAAGRRDLIPTIRYCAIGA